METLKRPTQADLDAMSHAEKDALIFKLFDIIEQFNDRITVLENRAKKNSHNSSKPPSSDGLKKGAAQPRERGKNTSGGQKGHQGHTLQMSDHPDVVEILLPETEICACGATLNNAEAKQKERRQQIDIPAPQVMPWIRPLAPVSTSFRTRSAPPISHSTFIWIRPSPPATSWAIRACEMAP